LQSRQNALLRGLLAAALLFALADCQRAEKVSAGSSEDQAYPADIEDLACHAVSGTGVQCSWTAVGDDQNPDTQGEACWSGACRASASSAARCVRGGFR